MPETRQLSPVQASVLFAAQQRAMALTAQANEAQTALNHAIMLVADSLGVPVSALGDIDLTHRVITLNPVRQSS